MTSKGRNDRELNESADVTLGDIENNIHYVWLMFCLSIAASKTHVTHMCSLPPSLFCKTVNFEKRKDVLQQESKDDWEELQRLKEKCCQCNSRSVSELMQRFLHLGSEVIRTEGRRNNICKLSSSLTLFACQWYIFTCLSIWQIIQ